jgi:hypothetical protein
LNEGRLGLPHGRPLSRHNLHRHDGGFVSASSPHRTEDSSDFVKRYGLHRLIYAEHYERIVDAIAREKTMKKWRREWKIRLIEEQNPDWLGRFGYIL